MDDKMLKEDYDRICLKVRQNCQKIGNDLREFPAREDGNYLWGEALPRLVLSDDHVTPLRPLPAHAVVYNFSRYRWLPEA